MDTSRWTPFDQNAGSVDYPGEKLKRAWKRLHVGDCEPWPEDERLQEAWRRFHRGEFGAAVTLADQVGPAGHAVANKSAGIYADYLEDDEATQQAIYKACVKRAEAAIARFPEDANAHYFHAFTLGRYAQSISIAKALSQGLGGKIKASLDRVLALAPQHAEAHTALGLYHAEILSKVGKLVGSMTYGASADKALEHFETSLAIARTPIALIEFGNGLYMLFGDRRLEESNQAYAEAAAMKPIDAMQALDVRYAKSSLE